MMPDRNCSVFVVHGRNTKARDAMFAFLRALGLHPIEWSEAVQATGKPTPYIGDILDAAFARAGAVVVLFTPDDEARLRHESSSSGDAVEETEWSGQARPNVLFEAGMARQSHKESTVFVELGQLRPFSDISGLHVVRIDNSLERRKDLANRLRNAGCPVNLDGTDWHSAGDFSSAVPASNFREPGSTGLDSARPETPASSSELSAGAVEMLRRANADTSKKIVIGPSKHGPSAIFAGSYPFDLSEPRARAESRGALAQLLDEDMIEKVPSDDDRTVHEVTTTGFRWLDTNKESEIASVLLPAISSDGRKLLRVAVETDEPIVCKSISEQQVSIKIGKAEIRTEDIQSSSRWDNALWELKGLELVEEGPAGVFSVTGKGRHFADRLGH